MTTLEMADALNDAHERLLAKEQAKRSHWSVFGRFCDEVDWFLLAMGDTEREAMDAAEPHFKELVSQGHRIAEVTTNEYAYRRWWERKVFRK
jgi:hypothetical protein